MKEILAFVMLLAAGIGAFTMWGSMHAHRAAGSGSQIFIHGTPVCVTQRAGGIEAFVGECGSLSGGRGEDAELPGGVPHRYGIPGHGLPPGHPPIDADPGGIGGDEVRRIPI